MTLAPTFEKCCPIFQLKVATYFQSYFNSKCTTNRALGTLTDGVTQSQTAVESVHMNQSDTQSSQFLVTNMSARHSTRPHYFYCPSPDFTSRCADCRDDTRGHFNCLSVGNKQSLCPFMWGGLDRVHFRVGLSPVGWDLL